MFRSRSTPWILVGALLVMAGPTLASSHREAPFVTEHPKVDGTDFYMFRSYEPGREGFVTLVANYLPLQDAYGGPNYFTLDPLARYRINIENDGDSVEDIVFEFSFLNINNRGTVPVGGLDVAHPFRTATPLTPGVEPNEAELYVVRVDRGEGGGELATNGAASSVFFAKALDRFGDKTFPDYVDHARRRMVPILVPGCGEGRVFVGQRKEPFAVNLGEVFDLVNLNPVGEPDAKRSATQDKNVTSLALELPIDCLTGSGNVIGGWTTAHLPRTRVLAEDPGFEEPETGSDGYVQVSRLGMPLVNEVVIGLEDKNRFNASHPVDDLARFAPYVTNPTLPEVLEVLFGVPAPDNFPRADLVAAFVTGIEGVNDLGVGEMLRLNTAIPPTPAGDQHRLGVLGGDLAGFPNGRRPGDDVVDIALRVVMGSLCHPIEPLGGLELGLCTPEDAPAGDLPYTDQAYQGPDQFDSEFPYLRTPRSGSPNGTRTFHANLTGAQEIPSVATPAAGGCGAVLSPSGSEIAISCTHDVTDVVGAHLHGAPEGTNGPVLCAFPDPSSPIQFVCPLDASSLESVRRGNTYVNIHSAAFPGGEIRGQLE